MLDMNFFKNPRFTAANLAITLTFFAMFGSMFLMTQYWQFVHGYTPLQAGVRLIPFAMVMMVTAPLSARIVESCGTKVVVTTGLLTVTLALLLLSFIHPQTGYWTVIGAMCLMSVGMGLTMAPATESVMGSLPREKAGVGSAVNDTTRQMGGALGVAIIGTLVASVYSSGISSIASAFGLTAAQTTAAKGSLGSALTIAADPNSGDQGPGGVRRQRPRCTSSTGCPPACASARSSSSSPRSWRSSSSRPSPTTRWPTREADRSASDDADGRLTGRRSCAPVAGD